MTPQERLAIVALTFTDDPANNNKNDDCLLILFLQLLRFNISFLHFQIIYDFPLHTLFVTDMEAIKVLLQLREHYKMCI